MDTKIKVINIIEKNKGILINKDIKVETLLKEYFEFYNEKWNEDWGEKWYVDVESDINEYDFLMAMYSINEWMFEYNKDKFFLEIDRENNYISNINDKIIQEKDFFKYLANFNIDNRNILDIIPECIVHRTGV